MSRISALFRLQEIDLELDAHRARLQSIEQALGDNPAVSAARLQAAAARQKLNAARGQARSFDLDLQAINEKVSETEKRLYSGLVANPKELRDLEQDLASLRRRSGGVEERELDAMIAVESAEGQVAALEAELQQAETAAAQTQKALLDEREHLLARAEQLGGEREALFGAIATEDQGLYLRLRQTKHGRALAKIDEGSCSACGEEVSSAHMQEARRSLSLVRCGCCERILYAGNN